jgi:hypothetical protein
MKLRRGCKPGVDTETAACAPRVSEIVAQDEKPTTHADN